LTTMHRASLLQLAVYGQHYTRKGMDIWLGMKATGKNTMEFGKSVEDALRGFDMYYRENQPKPIKVAPTTTEPLVKYLHEYLVPLQKRLNRHDAA